MAIDILVVDDEADIRNLVSDILKDVGFSPRAAKNSSQAFDKISENVPDGIILDIWLKDSELDGLGILETVNRKYPDLPVIIISGHGNIETAVNSLKMGAFDYIEKPFKQERLVHTLNLALENRKLKSENISLKSNIKHPDILIGDSYPISQLKSSIEKVAPTNSRVFIAGPAGSGKESIARDIHSKSLRSNNPFIVVETEKLTPENAEKILFGTEDSGDVNAPPRIIGYLEKAHGGTIFIDEITNIPKSIQGKMVRFLQDKSFERVGNSKKIEVDARVISASSVNVEEEMKNGNLREDLYYRLSVVPLKVPSLKERRNDIPTLCQHFISIATPDHKKEQKLSEEALAAMQVYDWPGNVRQLRNVIDWMMILIPESEEIISSDFLPREVLSTTPSSIMPDTNSDIMSMKLRDARELFEKQYLAAQISRFGGNISRTATFIGMERSALHRKLKMLDLASVPGQEEVEEEEREKVEA